MLQIKLASVKLAMKYMKRVSAELETVDGGPEEEELIVQGVRFAFRVHQVIAHFETFTVKYSGHFSFIVLMKVTCFFLPVCWRF
jgi:hypothetical protein